MKKLFWSQKNQRRNFRFIFHQIDVGKNESPDPQIENFEEESTQLDLTNPTKEETVSQIDDTLNIPQNIIDFINEDPKKAESILTKSLEITQEKLKRIEEEEENQGNIPYHINNFFDTLIEHYKGMINRVPLHAETYKARIEKNKSLRDDVLNMINTFEGDSKDLFSAMLKSFLDFRIIPTTNGERGLIRMQYDQFFEDRVADSYALQTSNIKSSQLDDPLKNINILERILKWVIKGPQLRDDISNSFREFLNNKDNWLV